MIAHVITRRNIIAALVALGIILLALELILFFPRALEWHPWDYGNYVRMGNDVRQGVNPYGPNRYYPLPTMLWIFVPLSLLPDWFRFVWIVFPFVIVLRLFRLNGILLFFFPPLWWVVTDAMFDAWLLIPLAWLFTNRRTFAGIGAAVLLFKPHVTLFAVAYVWVRWMFARDWQNVRAFVLTFGALWLPSFVVDPAWLLKMLEMLPTRVEQGSVLPLITTSLWSWWALGGPARLVFFALLLAAGILFWRAQNRAAAFQLAQLLLVPVILSTNLITALPALESRNQIIAIVSVGLAALALDSVMGGFGGWYAFVPLAALWFQKSQ